MDEIRTRGKEEVKKTPKFGHHLLMNLTSIDEKPWHVKSFPVCMIIYFMNNHQIIHLYGYPSWKSFYRENTLFFFIANLTFLCQWRRNIFEDTEDKTCSILNLVVTVLKKVYFQGFVPDYDGDMSLCPHMFQRFCMPFLLHEQRQLFFELYL